MSILVTNGWKYQFKLIQSMLESMLVSLKFIAGRDNAAHHVHAKHEWVLKLIPHIGPIDVQESAVDVASQASTHREW